MKTLGKLFLFAPVFAFLLLSCSKDETDDLVKEGGPFKISELAGNWEATAAFFVSDSDSNIFVDIIDDGGSSTITVQSTGRFVLTINPADRAAYTVSGEMSWEKWEGDYYFAIEWDNYPGDWDTYGATLTATTFKINGSTDTGEYDFDNDGTFESARIGFEFTRV
jgi:hypothetical protein